MNTITANSKWIGRIYRLTVSTTVVPLLLLIFSSVWVGKPISAQEIDSMSPSQRISQLRMTVIADGYTENQLVQMSLYKRYPEPRGTVTVPIFELVSNGTDAVGETSIQLEDGYYQFYMWGLDTTTAPLAKSMLHIDGDQDIVIRIDTPPADYDWSGEGIDLNEQNPPYILNAEGAIVEITADALQDSRADYAYLGPDIEEVLITEEYTLLAYQYYLSVSASASKAAPQLVYKFSEPVTVTLPYDLGRMAATISPEDLRISVAYGSETIYSNSEWDYRPFLIAPDSIDAENQTVTFTVEEEGAFGIVIPAASLDTSFNFFDHNLFIPMFGKMTE